MAEPSQSPPTVREIRTDGHVVTVTFEDRRILTFSRLEKDGANLGLHSVVIENPRLPEGLSGGCLAFFRGQDHLPRDEDFTITQIAGEFPVAAFRAYWESAVDHLRAVKPEEAGNDHAACCGIVLHPVALVCLRLVQLGRCGFRI